MARGVLYAFDLIELNDNDLRDELLIERKRRLAKLIGKSNRHAIRYNGHLSEDGITVFAHACRMGLEGIVSKRIDSRYTSGPQTRGLSRRTRPVRRCSVRVKKTGIRDPHRARSAAPVVVVSL